MPERRAAYPPDGWKTAKPRRPSQADRCSERERSSEGRPPPGGPRRGDRTAPVPVKRWNHHRRWTPVCDKGPAVRGQRGLSPSPSGGVRWQRKAVSALSVPGERSARAPLSRRSVRSRRPMRRGPRRGLQTDAIGAGWPRSDSTPGRPPVRCARPRAWSRARSRRARGGAIVDPAHPAHARVPRVRRGGCTPRQAWGLARGNGADCALAT